MRQFFAIILLISFSVQIRGYHIFFNYKQANLRKIAKRTIRQRLKEDNIEEFVFSLAKGHEAPVWVNDHEFRFRGEMYDVIDKKIENGKVHIRCISDEKERVLIDNYQKIVKNDFEKNSKKRASLISKLVNTLFTHSSLLGKAMFTDLQKSKWCVLEPSLLSTKSEVLTPPPKFA